MGTAGTPSSVHAPPHPLWRTKLGAPLHPLVEERAHPVGWALLLVEAVGPMQAWWGKEIHPNDGDPWGGEGGVGQGWHDDFFQSHACGHASGCVPLDGGHGSADGGGGGNGRGPSVPLLEKELD